MAKILKRRNEDYLKRMQREILFKAKRKDNNEWVYGSLVIHKDILWKNQKYYYIETDTGEDRFEVIPETICQYTGLKDKNGNKIFENDKVKYDYKFSHEIGVVTYNQENASYQIKGIPSSSMKHRDRLIIVGNKCDEVDNK